MSAEPGRLRSLLRLAASVVLAASLLALANTYLEAPLGPRTLEAAARVPLPADVPCDRWVLLVGVGQERGATVSLFTDGLAALVACTGEARELVLRGTPARGRGAYAVLRDDVGVAFAGHVDGEAVVRVRGDLRLAFTNDLATADEDRNLHAALR